MSVLNADRALASRIERSVARDLERYAAACTALDPSLDVATERFAGGLAIFVAPGSPINMVFGAGMAGPVTPAELDAVGRFFAERGARAAISLSPLADESLVVQLGVRGWMVTDFENVLVRRFMGDASALAAALPAPAPGVSLREATDAAERAQWGRISAGAFSAPEDASREIVRLGEAAALREDMTLLLGSVDGVDAGSGALWVDDRLGWMLGDATLPAHRRRGVQSALLAERTRLAAVAGCELAVTEARPGSTSQRNMERLGYSVVYTRVELVAPPTRQ